MQTPSDSAILARLDERTERAMTDISEIKDMLAHEYVRQAEFNPVQKIVYGIVGVVVLAVLGALVALVVQGKQGA